MVAGSPLRYGLAFRFANFLFQDWPQANLRLERIFLDRMAASVTLPFCVALFWQDRLEAYNAAWGLKVNADKTKVAVFEGRRGQAAVVARRRAPAPLPTAVGPTFTCGGAAL